MVIYSRALVNLESDSLPAFYATEQHVSLQSSLSGVRPRRVPVL